MESRLDRLRNTAIFGFISTRWAEAKEDLALIDPAFVASLDSWDSVLEEGVILPDKPTPTKRLSGVWYHVLEATIELLLQMDRTRITADKIASAEDRVDAMYYQYTYSQDLFGLCEKVNRLIEYTCGLNDLGRREDKYRNQVGAIRDRVGEASRHGLVHGATGGGGRPSEGITEKSLWETLVGFGDEVLPSLLDPSDTDVGPGDSRAQSATVGYFERLGEILQGLDEDIKRTRARK